MRKRNPSDMWLDKQKERVLLYKEFFSNLLLQKSISPKNILIIKKTFDKAEVLIHQASIELTPWRRDEIMTDLSILLDKLDIAFDKLEAS